MFAGGGLQSERGALTPDQPTAGHLDGAGNRYTPSNQRRATPVRYGSLGASMANTLIELTELWFGRPTIGASDAQCAAWYTEKGQVHERLAEQALTAQERQLEKDYATAAFQHARRLRAGSGGSET